MDSTHIRIGKKQKDKLAKMAHEAGMKQARLMNEIIDQLDLVYWGSKPGRWLEGLFETMIKQLVNAHYGNSDSVLARLQEIVRDRGDESGIEITICPDGSWSVQLINWEPGSYRKALHFEANQEFGDLLRILLKS